MKKLKSVLIIGGSGFVGFHLASHLRNFYKVFATYHKNLTKLPGVSFLPLNLSSRNWIKRILYLTQPDILIYAAGSNRLDFCHEHKGETEFLHSIALSNILSGMDIIQPRFIYLSNSYVFDGTKGNFHETDTTLPVSILGRMKLGGENAIRIKCLHYIILRASPLFGVGNGRHFSFLNQLRMSLNAGKKVELNGDTLYSFAPIQSFLLLVHQIIESGIKNRIIHYGGLTKLTDADFGKLFAKKFGYSPLLIFQKKYKNTLPQNRPPEEDYLSDFSLNCTQAFQLFQTQPLLIEEGLDLLQQQLAAA